MVEALPAVAVPHTHGNAKLAILHAAQIARILAAIYFEGARCDGDLHLIAANGNRDISPVLDLIELQHGIAKPASQFLRRPG